MSARPAKDTNKDTDIPEKLYDGSTGTYYERKRFFGKVRNSGTGFSWETTVTYTPICRCVCMCMCVYR